MYHTGITCYDGEVRLVNGSQPHEGRVEVCFNETWGTICDNISPYEWNTSQANVVCKHLGYTEACKKLYLTNLLTLTASDWISYNYSDSSTHSFGNGSAPINIADVYCKGFESNLAECVFTSGIRNCDGSQYYRIGIIGVQCSSSKQKWTTYKMSFQLRQYVVWSHFCRLRFTKMKWLLYILSI